MTTFQKNKKTYKVKATRLSISNKISILSGMLEGASYFDGIATLNVSVLDLCLDGAEIKTLGDLDDYIEGEEEKTIIGNSNNNFIQNSINSNVRKNNVNNLKDEKKYEQNNHTINENENNKFSQNQSFEGGVGGGPPGSLFDTGKADLLCLLLGMSNK
jgi:hypothetical protein